MWQVGEWVAMGAWTSGTVGGCLGARVGGGWVDVSRRAGDLEGERVGGQTGATLGEKGG